MKIRNINDKYGMPVEFEGEDLPECIEKMAFSIAACDFENGQTLDDLCWRLKENVDYEIIS